MMMVVMIDRQGDEEQGEKKTDYYYDNSYSTTYSWH